MHWMTVPTVIAMALLSTACQSPETRRPAETRGTAGAVTAAADLPEPPPPTRGTPSDADAKAVEPAATELARRAEAGDRAYIAKLMGNATGDDAAADMIGRIKRGDVAKTFRQHLAIRGPETAGLNYHDPSHFQVDLKKEDGAWKVTRLWFCR